jgi:hypothetical protein
MKKNDNAKKETYWKPPKPRKEAPTKKRTLVNADY